MEYDLKKRTKDLALRVVKLIDDIPKILSDAGLLPQPGLIFLKTWCLLEGAEPPNPSPSPSHF